MAMPAGLVLPHAVSAGMYVNFSGNVSAGSHIECTQIEKKPRRASISRIVIPLVSIAHDQHSNPISKKQKREYVYERKQPRTASLQSEQARMK
eukprot:936409-Pleurochrysis_carterae.AAC.5